MTDKIEEKYHQLMNDTAHLLDGIFNGPDRSAPRKTGFMLTVFDFDEPNGGRFNYISNADKIDIRAALKDVIARIEGRMQAETPTQQ